MRESLKSSDRATDYFCQGYNCAQSTAAAFAGGEAANAATQGQSGETSVSGGTAPATALGEAAILAAMSGFGGGIGGTRTLCGAVTGMVFAIGAANGSRDPHDSAAKTALYVRVREAIDEFTDRFGTTNCRELLLKAGVIPKPDPSVRNAEYYATRPCSHFVAAAAEIAERKIAEVRALPQAQAK
jgi:C_GCAxxG_C_C family probable redox protein